MKTTSSPPLRSVHKTKSVVLGLIATAVVLQAGSCGGSTVTQLTTELGTIATGSTSRVDNFYSHVNEIHRQIYLDYQNIGMEPPDSDNTPIHSTAAVSETEFSSIRLLLADAPSDIGGGATRPYYSANAIKARVTSASFLETYAVKLRILANSTNAADSKRAASDLADRLNSLGDIVAQIDLPHAKKAAEDIKNIGGIAKLANLGAQGIVKFFRAKWTPEVIRNNGVWIQDGCTALDDDARLTASRVNNRLAGLQRHYQQYYRENESKKDPDQTKHERYMDELDKISKFRLQVESENPSNIYSNFKMIHEQLIKIFPERIQK